MVIITINPSRLFQSGRIIWFACLAMYRCAPLLKIHLSYISEQFNAYEFQDYWEQVIDL
jgi:hypothetical protein